MRILISGASGLVGTALAARLAAAGHTMLRLVRRAPASADEIEWSPAEVRFPADFRCDAVVHLAGESVAGLWTTGKQRRIRESRVQGTRTLSEALARLEHKPAIMACASAVGFYGPRGDETLTEASGAGAGFLAETCVEWEAASTAARESGIRVAHLRLGVVLARQGGMLGALAPLFRAGLGSRLGNGRQWLSWIAMEDLLRMFELALHDPRAAGPINAVAPQPVTNAEFTRALARTVHRWTAPPVPAFLLRLAPGGMAEEFFLISQKVLPARAEALGFAFSQPELSTALAYELGSHSR